MQLPKDINPIDFDERFRLQPDAWIEVIRDVCAKHGVACDDPIPFTDGSNLIAAVSGLFVVKIFPPFHRHQWESERRALRRLWNHGLSIPIPRLIAEGEREDVWTYVILSKLPGVTLESIWPGLPQDAKAKLLGQIGEIMAQVHAVPVVELHDLAPKWRAFLNAQLTGFRTRHQRLGMPEWFLNEAESFVSEKFALVPDQEPVILTGEYTPFNLLAERDAGEWRITGMIDFGDAMIGFREYDFLGPCLFLGEGNPALIESMFRGYGYAGPRTDKGLRERLLLLAILHRYSNLKFQVRIAGWEERVKSLAELGNLIFP